MPRRPRMKLLKNKWTNKRPIEGDQGHFTEYQEHCDNFFGRWTLEIITLKDGKIPDFSPDFDSRNSSVKIKKVYIHVKSKSRTCFVDKNFKEEILVLTVLDLFHFF